MDKERVRYPIYGRMNTPFRISSMGGQQQTCANDSQELNLALGC